jgi:dCTP deaminase
MLNDSDIRAALQAKEIVLEPFDPQQLQSASYDARVGAEAFSSTVKEKLDLSKTGLLVIEPGEFAMILTREHFRLDKQHAGMLGLRSEYAKQGLLMLSGPQIDPTFDGVLKVRLINLAPKPIALTYEAPFLTIQFFRLSSPVNKEYLGPSQGQEKITSADIQELIGMKGMTLGEVMKSLGALAQEVAALGKTVAKLEGSVSKFGLFMGVFMGLMTLVVTIVGIIVAIHR